MLLVLGTVPVRTVHGSIPTLRVLYNFPVKSGPLVLVRGERRWTTVLYWWGPPLSYSLSSVRELLGLLLLSLELYAGVLLEQHLLLALQDELLDVRRGRDVQVRRFVLKTWAES